MLVIPMTFLGAVYYPWQNAHAVAVAEGRGAREPAHLHERRDARRAHQRRAAHADRRDLLALIGFTAVFLKLGIDGFKKRVLS